MCAWLELGRDQIQRLSPLIRGRYEESVRGTAQRGLTGIERGREGRGEGSEREEGREGGGGGGSEGEREREGGRKGGRVGEREGGRGREGS